MKSLREIREMVATTQAGDTNRILDICDALAENMQRLEHELKQTDRVARDAALGPARIRCE